MKKRKVIKITKLSLLSIFLLIFLLPFFLVVLNSFKTTQQFVENPFSWPTQLNFDNYIGAFDSMNFPTAFMNSIILTVCGTFIIVLFSSMLAYLLARFDWKINKIIFVILIASMTVPFQVIMIPLVTIYGQLGVLDSRLTMIFMYLGFGTSLATFIFHGFIKGIPIALEEAATIDGCSRIRIFFQIVLPLLKPVVTTIVILDILWLWNDYLLPSLILQSPKLRTLPLSVYNFFSTYSVNYSALMAGLVMTLLPILILYLFLQKYIIKGVARGAIK